MLKLPFLHEDTDILLGHFLPDIPRTPSPRRYFSGQFLTGHSPGQFPPPPPNLRQLGVMVQRLLVRCY